MFAIAAILVFPIVCLLGYLLGRRITSPRYSTPWTGCAFGPPLGCAVAAALVMTREWFWTGPTPESSCLPLDECAKLGLALSIALLPILGLPWVLGFQLGRNSRRRSKVVRDAV